MSPFSTVQPDTFSSFKIDPSCLEALRSLGSMAQAEMPGRGPIDTCSSVGSGSRKKGGDFRDRKHSQTAAVLRVRHQQVFSKHETQRLALEPALVWREWGAGAGNVSFPQSWA